MSFKAMDAYLEAGGVVGTARAKVQTILQAHSLSPALDAAGQQALADLDHAEAILKSASMASKLAQLDDFSTGRTVRNSALGETRGKPNPLTFDSTSEPG